MLHSEPRRAWGAPRARVGRAIRGEYVKKNEDRRSTLERVTLSRIVRGHHLLERLAKSPAMPAALEIAIDRYLDELNSLTDTLARYHEERAVESRLEKLGDQPLKANGKNSSVLS